MRALTLTAVAVLFVAADGSALAQSCGKGMLWPYVRQPGDCLTDEEIRVGQRGVYNGPINTNPDMSGVRVDTPAQSSGVTGTSGPAAPSPAATAPSPAAPAAQTITAPAGPPGPSLNGPGFSAPAARAAVADCSKGLLWPFVRSPGDCLTDAEKGNGQTGVYRASEVVASAAPSAPPPGVTQVSAPGPAGSPAPASGDVATSAGGSVDAEPACTKGWLWPFVRRPGDCPTDVERGRGRR